MASTAGSTRLCSSPNLLPSIHALAVSPDFVSINPTSSPTNPHSWLSVGLSSLALIVIPTDLILTAKSKINHLRICIPLYVVFELAWLAFLIIGFAPKKGSRSELKYLVTEQVGLPPHYTDESYSNGFFGECAIVLVVFVCVGL
jgi:hypothetical protein